ncbi:hypothetical protein GYMLUDRAFT_98259 [Collybiopsis luxurians FD-317 M1]|uniref:Protein kinase domain-containing protein n=1 Tax=Collybiopsis luxurians FD-317 M1 TaxID=944289 RepID=A0A0D0B455_9AGAR|nr:hypothetical protein GYMLUDRAFT_98259 [Collybiopsis luxurians FD-317 M1]
MSTDHHRDPFEHSRLNSLENMFDKSGPEYQWFLDLYQKLHGKHLGITNGVEKSTRIVCRTWPRDPKGDIIRELPPGKHTPNSTHLWGATLMDFFRFQRGPEMFLLSTISTGSRLSAWMKYNGEAEYAKDEMAWAAAEEEPRVRPAADILEILKAKDLMIMMGSCGESLKDEEKIDDEEVDDGSSVRPFDYDKYPDPWPLVPFSSNPPTLQSPIPFHLLPETLIVHDPFRLLHATEVDNEGDWTSISRDRIHKYHLNLTADSIRQSIEVERMKIENSSNRTDPIEVGVLLELTGGDESQHTGSSPVAGNAHKLTVPPPPPPPSFTPEAHLFISPAHVIGKGNHSLVYRAEWDLPRTLFSKPKICMTCVEKAAREVLQKRSEKMKTGSSAESSGNFVLQEAHRPEIVFTANKVFDPTGASDSTCTHTLRDHAKVSYFEYTGSMSTVYIDTVPWYDPGSTTPAPCLHLMQNSISGPLPRPVPPTAPVSVIAKLSLAGDDHLEKEAVNYQRFGAQFSQHWTGYTLTQPLLNPTPMGAITPIFYGYYSKEGAEESSRYFSPILLLEDCGTPINPYKLDFDDRQECAALVLRLHYHGWTQGSFFPRNILMQLGDHSEFPLMRSLQDRRFRLIDFGRAKCQKDAQDWGGGESFSQDQWDRERFDEKGMIGTVLNFEHPT